MPVTERRRPPDFDDPARWGRTELRELNHSPAGYLAAVGAWHGAPWPDSFNHALDLLESFGTSRAIRAADAARLCRQMRAWATSRRPGPT